MSPARCASAGANAPTAVTALPVNDIVWLVEDLMMQGGVDVSHVIWREFDGLGRNTRVGLNFTEKGFGVRAALGCSDRGHSAASPNPPGRSELGEAVRRRGGALWFHTGGIFAALASNTAEAVIEAVEAAHKHGTIVSYDLNYRASLWKSQGGKDGAQKINRTIAPHVDVMIGNEEDFTACLGFAVEGLDEHISKIDPANFKTMIAEAVKAFPNFKVAATTLRNAKTASVQRLGRGALRRRRSSTRRRCARTSRSTTGSAAATASPPGWPTASSKARGRRRRSNTARRTARWR